MNEQYGEYTTSNKWCNENLKLEINSLMKI